MKKLLILMIVGAFTAGCNYTGKPVEFANICDKANDRQYVEVTGFFRNTGSAMCSKSGNEPTRCPIGFADKEDALPVMAYIDHGSGASSIENSKERVSSSATIRIKTSRTKIR